MTYEHRFVLPPAPDPFDDAPELTPDEQSANDAAVAEFLRRTGEAPGA